MNEWMNEYFEMSFCIKVYSYDYYIKKIKIKIIEKTTKWYLIKYLVINKVGYITYFIVLDECMSK